MVTKALGMPEHLGTGHGKEENPIQNLRDPEISRRGVEDSSEGHWECMTRELERPRKWDATRAE